MTGENELSKSLQEFCVISGLASCKIPLPVQYPDPEEKEGDDAEEEQEAREDDEQ
jgi:hypothetical protein